MTEFNEAMRKERIKQMKRKMKERAARDRATLRKGNMSDAEYEATRNQRVRNAYESVSGYNQEIMRDYGGKPPFPHDANQLRKMHEQVNSDADRERAERQRAYDEFRRKHPPQR